jgi:hypothetical protein
LTALPRETKICRYLVTHPLGLVYLKELKASKELDDLSGWEKFRVHYFYPDNPLQENAK